MGVDAWRASSTWIGADAEHVLKTTKAKLVKAVSDLILQRIELLQSHVLNVDCIRVQEGRMEGEIDWDG